MARFRAYNFGSALVLKILVSVVRLRPEPPRTIKATFGWLLLLLN